MLEDAPRRPQHGSSSRLLLPLMLLTVLVGSLTVSTGAQAPSSDPLTYSRGFLLTGDYVVGGVDLPRGGGEGVINIGTGFGNAVPADAEIAAAYLYWEALAPTGAPLVEARFRGTVLDTVKATRLVALPGGSGANCWGSSGGANRVLTMFRADVLHLLPKRYDADDKWTGKYLVNNADLASHSLPAHSVTMGSPGGGNTLMTVAGATLLIVYRDPAAPLRKVVIYDGAEAQAQGATTTRTLQGFYRSSQARSAKLTHIVGSGAGNAGERLLFNGHVLATNPVPDPIDGGSDRGWANPTFDVSALMPGSQSQAFGESVTTSIDHGANNQRSSPYECLSWGAIIFSTTVADVDRDGLPDGIEDAPAGLRDPPTPAYPDGQLLPNLHQMGASVGPRDLFVEINAMRATGSTSYGSPAAPYNATTPTVTDPDGHDHMPGPAVLKMVGDAYVRGGITPHFDVGRLDEYAALYPCLGSDPECDATEYLVASGFARGGERIEERACENCQFQDYPGTVGWPFGFQLYRDAPVSQHGEEIASFNDLGAALPDEGKLRRRFDRARQDYFHYALYAHARGKAKSPLPCLDAAGEPTEYDGPERACATGRNPAFHVPSSASGVADLPGSNVLVTLGLWDTEHFVGTDFIQASTTLHELGHNLNLWHGGAPAVFGNKAQSTTTFLEPNCKPNYLSSMSYLFQVHGLFDDAGRPQLDYSSTRHEPLNEMSLNDGPLMPSGKYRAAWFAPVDSPLASSSGATPARRYCHGQPFAPGVPAPLMARVQARTTSDAIDWDGNHQTGTASADVNFDNAAGLLVSHDDWANLRLDQIGAGRRARIFSSARGDLLDFGSGDLLDFGSGDLLDFGSGDLLDFGAGTHIVHLGSGDFFKYGAGDLLDFGTGDLLDFGSGDLLDFGTGVLMYVGADGDLLDFGTGDLLDFGSGDLLDFGTGDLLDFGSGSGLQELDFDMALDLAAPRPHALEVCVLGVDCPEPQPAPSEPNYHRMKLTWKAPTFGVVSQYEVYRATANGTPSLIGTASDRQFIDTEELPNGVQFTYSVKARFAGDRLSPNSDSVAKTAVNEPPVAVDDAYETPFGVTLSVGAPGVLGNDSSDVDSGAESRRLRAVVTGPSHGTLQANADGSFVYVPNAGFSGNDSFTYTADNGIWGGDTTTPLSSASNIATVTIVVAPSARYGFNNVDNLPPPPDRAFYRGSTVPLKWQWTDAAAVPVDTSSASPRVEAVACSTHGKLPPALTVGVFTPERPGNGNSFAYDATTFKWQFNWKLHYTSTDSRGRTTTTALPAGTYVVRIISEATGQSDPTTVNTCGGASVPGALITVK